jgi:hypothetical protein
MKGNLTNPFPNRQRHRIPQMPKKGKGKNQSYLQKQTQGKSLPINCFGAGDKRQLCKNCGARTQKIKIGFVLIKKNA